MFYSSPIAVQKKKKKKSASDASFVNRTWNVEHKTWMDPFESLLQNKSEHSAWGSNWTFSSGPINVVHSCRWLLPQNAHTFAGRYILICTAILNQLHCTNMPLFFNFSSIVFWTKWRFIELRLMHLKKTPLACPSQHATHYVPLQIFGQQSTLQPKSENLRFFGLSVVSHTLFVFLALFGNGFKGQVSSMYTDPTINVMEHSLQRLFTLLSDCSARSTHACEACLLLEGPRWLVNGASM